jgi:hypothetical protein
MKWIAPVSLAGALTAGLVAVTLRPTPRPEALGEEVAARGPAAVGSGPSARTPAAPPKLLVGEVPQGPGPAEPAAARRELEEQLARMDQEIAERDVVTRLNKGLLTEAQRLEAGDLLRRAAEARAKITQLDLADIERDLAAYEATHRARVARVLANGAAKTPSRN